MQETMVYVRRILLTRIKEWEMSEHASIYQHEKLLCTILLDLVEAELFNCGVDVNELKLSK